MRHLLGALVWTLQILGCSDTPSGPIGRETEVDCSSVSPSSEIPQHQDVADATCGKCLYLAEGTNVSCRATDASPLECCYEYPDATACCTSDPVGDPCPRGSSPGWRWYLCNAEAMCPGVRVCIDPDAPRNDDTTAKCVPESVGCGWL